MIRCALCGRESATIFCSGRCAKRHEREGRALISIDVRLTDFVADYAREAGLTYEHAWTALFRIALDRLGAPLGAG